MAGQASGGGLLHSLGALVATLVAVLHTRLELLSTDLEELREHLVAQFVLVFLALFCLGMGAVLATALVVAAFWDTHRLLVLAVLAGLFVVAGLSSWAIAARRARTKPKPFAATLSELLKDREQLMSKS